MSNLCSKLSFNTRNFLAQFKSVDKFKEPFDKSATCNVDLEASTPPTAVANEYEAGLQPLEEEVPRALAIPNQFNGDLEALDQKVKSMMQRSGKLVPVLSSVKFVEKRVK